MEPIQIAGRKVGPGQPCFIIAEAGVNHNGDIEMAKRLVEAAARARADAVKFQTFRAERLVALGAPKADYQVSTCGDSESQLEMLRRVELSSEAHRDLQAYCHKQNLLFLSTPFDEASADLLEALDLPAFKIPSGEITNLPFLAYVAEKQRPMIVSTGMSSLEEVREAVDVIRRSGNENFVLLHCVSAYPAPPADVNLRVMRTMAEIFGVPVGYSDHTQGTEIALAAVALGACVIEKHFTLDRNLPGPDHRASIEPDELAALVRGIRLVEAALGHGRKERGACEANTAAVVRKSIVAACDITAGTLLTTDLIAVKRPGTGLPPSMLKHLIGRRVTRDIPMDTLLTLDMLQ